MRILSLLYNFLIQLVEWFFWVPALFNTKLKLGWQGRKVTIEKLKSEISPTDRTIWIHVASLGEFEQGRPVLDSLKTSYPGFKIVLTFFSPSGFEKRKDYKNADIVCYLPLDTKSNAKAFLETVRPDLAIFVKYELWPNYLNQLKELNVKSILISTVIQQDNWLLKNARNWFKKMMNAFSIILCQDEQTVTLLNKLEVNGLVKLGGDTRIDRTIQIAAASEPIPIVEKFVKTNNILVVGSSWPKDEIIIASLLKHEAFKDWKLILAPHDIQPTNVQRIQSIFKDNVTYSQFESEYSNQKTLLIDNVGLLNKLYRYANIAYIGGGFGKGIHNTLEPAAFNIPVIFGPKYHKFIEAKSLVKTGGAFVIGNEEAFLTTFKALRNSENYKGATQAVQRFMEINRGAVDTAMLEIKKLMNAGKN